MKYELVGEISNHTFTQNQEFFANDLRIYNRSKMIYMNLSTLGNQIIQLTFDGGTNWIDMSDSKKFNFIDFIRFFLDPNESLNFRCTDISGVTVQHLHVYSEYSY